MNDMLITGQVSSTYESICTSCKNREDYPVCIGTYYSLFRTGEKECFYPKQNDIASCDNFKPFKEGF